MWWFGEDFDVVRIYSYNYDVGVMGFDGKIEYKFLLVGYNMVYIGELNIGERLWCCKYEVDGVWDNE